jgi:molecular chaperone GrpE
VNEETKEIKEEEKHAHHEHEKHHDHPHHEEHKHHPHEEHGPHDHHEHPKPHEKHHDHHDKPGKEKKIVHDLEERMKKLETSLKEAEEKAMREKAEAINYRKRKDDEVARMMKYASEDMIKEILPIVDSFERAIDMDDDNLEDEVSKFLAGFKMIYCNLVNVLEKYEVKEIEAMGKEFDANFHQAVLTEPREGVESGIVIEVLQKGYMYKDKVLRPSMVKVSE